MDVPSPIDPEALLAETSMVRRLAQALVRRADLAHDVTQDVMLVALRQPHPPEHLRGWLAAVTRRLAGKARRSQQVRARHEGDAAPPPANDAEQHTTERLQLHRRLTDAVLALPEPYRTTLTLRFFDDLPPRAIAQRLGASSEVVRKRVSRGLEMLRERLDGDFGDRAQWLRAFAVVGLLPVGSPWLLLTVLAMNKLAVAAAAVLVAGVCLVWPDGVPSPVVPVVAAADGAAAVGSVADLDEELARAAAPTVREAGTVAPLPAPDCTVRLVDEIGRPIDDASVFAWRTGDLDAAHRVSDPEGRCAFGAWRGEGGLLVAADGRFLHREALAELAGQHDIVLPSGASIGGTLQVDGQPGAGWRMALRSGVPDDVPDRLRRRYGARGSAAVCDAFGRFEFVGVPADWSGTMSLPQPLWLLDGPVPDDPNLVPVTAGHRGLDLRATQLPTLRGRVIWSDTGEPVAWPSIQAHAEFSDGAHSPGLGYQGHRDGTFAIGLYDSRPSRRGRWLDPAQRPSLRDVTLKVFDSNHQTGNALRLDADRLASKTEHVFRLQRVQITHFRCIDDAGQPIASARVQARGTSGKTDTDGRGTCAGAADDVQLVGSPRHRIGPVAPRAPAAGTADDPLVFVLEPTNKVRVRIEGEHVDARRCLLRSAVPAFAGVRSRNALDDSLHGVDSDTDTSSHGRTGSDGTTEWYRHDVRFTTDAHGDATLWSLEPGTACELHLLDDFGRPVAIERFTAPVFGEESAVVLRPEGEAAPFVGRVLGDDGRPLAKVEAQFRVEDGEDSYSSYRYTDAQGRFELARPGDLSRATLNLQLEGYAEQRHEGLTTGAAPHTWVLQRGRALTVHVVDEHGEPLDLTPSWDRRHVEEKRDWLRTGVWRWRDLPPGKVTLHCTIGADEFELVHDTSEPVATLRVPRPGTLRIESPNGWPAVADARNALVAVLHCLDADHKDTRIWQPERGDPEHLLPGTWRIDLFEWSQPDRSLPAVERPLGLSAEVTLRAGDHATAILH